MHLRTLHPQFQGARVLWRPGMAEPELGLLEHGIFDDPRFINSPVRALYEGADGFRQRLDLPLDARDAEYSHLRGPARARATPTMWRCRCSSPTASGTRRAGARTSRAASRPTTWSRSTTSCRSWRWRSRSARTAGSPRTCSNTYVGQHAGERILSGDIRRGSGTTVQAAIWNCDLRGFTRISEQWPRDDVITG